MAAPEELLYTSEHEWVLVGPSTSSGTGGIATVGITAYAAEKLGDIVYVDLPKVGSTVVAGTVVGEIESTKSVGELFAPVAGTVVETNEVVVTSPEIVNADPFGAGWLIKVEFAQLPELLSLEQYTALTV